MTFVADTRGAENAVMVEKTFKRLLVARTAASEKLGGAVEGMEEMLETEPEGHRSVTVCPSCLFRWSCLLPQTTSAW